MKIVCREHIDISVPVERAFVFVTDIARWPIWFGCMVNAHLPENEELMAGAVLRVCMADGSRRRHGIFEVTRFVRNAFISLEDELSAARRFDLRFEQRGATSRVSIAAGYPVFGGIFPAMFDALFRRSRVRRELQESLLHLRGLLEDIDEAAHAIGHGHPLLAVDRSAQVA